MEIPEIVRDKLPVSIDNLETQRPGILLRSIDESKVELGYETDESSLTDREKLHIGLSSSIKLARSTLDVYQESLSMEAADDVRRQYQERIQFLKEKINQLQNEFRNIDVVLKGDPNVTPPCFKIEKATANDDDSS